MESFDEIVMQYLYCIAVLQFCIQFKQFLTTFKFKHLFKGFDNENLWKKLIDYQNQNSSQLTFQLCFKIWTLVVLL